MIHAILLFLAIQAAVPDTQQHQEAGITALKAANTQQAILEFKKVIELDPQNAPGHFGLGVTYIQTRDYGLAVAELKKAFELDKTLTTVHDPLGFALLQQGYADQALKEFQKGKDKGGLGMAQLETGDLPDAVHNLMIAAAERPNDPELMYYLARASGLLSKGLFDKLDAVYPDAPITHLADAENYAALRQEQEAEAQYKAALTARPDLRGAHLALGQLYARANKWPEAEEQFRAEAKVEPGNAEAAYRLGAALLQDGNAKDAVPELERSLRLQPDMPETLAALGKAQSMLTNYAAAEKAWSRVVTLEKTGPLAAEAHFGLAGIYRRQGKAADAAREMKLFQQAKNPQPQQ